MKISTMFFVGANAVMLSSTLLGGPVPWKTIGLLFVVCVLGILIQNHMRNRANERDPDHI